MNVTWRGDDSNDSDHMGLDCSAAGSWYYSHRIGSAVWEKI